MYREADHPLLGARASVKTPAALRRDASAGRLILDDASYDLMANRRAAQGLFLIVDGEGFVMVVPVPIRKGSDARTFASRLNTAANRLALSDHEPPASEVSTMAERYSPGSQVSPPKFAANVSVVPEVSRLPAASASASAAGPAGWFPDPTGRYTQRYWDGRSWTEHVARNGMRGRDPVARRQSGSVENLTGAVASMFGVRPPR